MEGIWLCFPLVPRSQTLLQLSDDLVDELDRRAAALGVSRSKLVRDLLWQGLGTARRSERSAAMLEAYQRMPQSDGRDDWGDLNEWTAAGTRRNFAALAAEEDGPW